MGQDHHHLTPAHRPRPADAVHRPTLALWSWDMTTPRQTVWSIEPHTAAKHELLKHYLGAWFPILASREGRIIFLDGFAGPGIYDDGQPGSPIVALRTLLDHSAFPRCSRCEFIFRFIEKDASRRDRLRTELRQFDPLPSNVKASTHLGEFQDVIEGVSESLSSRNRRLAPTLAFVDPFGVSGVPMELISRFLDSPKCELFLILMVDHLNRFLSAEHMRSGRDSLFGTDDFSEVEAAPAGERIPLLVDPVQAAAVRRRQVPTCARFRDEARQRNGRLLRGLRHPQHHRSREVQRRYVEGGSEHRLDVL